MAPFSENSQSDKKRFDDTAKMILMIVISGHHVVKLVKPAKCKRTVKTNYKLQYPLEVLPYV